MKKYHYGDPNAELNLSDLLEKGAQNWPDNVATIFEGDATTYAQLNAAANRLANGLMKLGIGAGDRVAIMLPNIPEFPVAYYAVLKLGATVVPVNTMFRGMEIQYILEDSQAKATIVWQPVVAEAFKALADSPARRSCIIVPEKGSAPVAAGSPSGLACFTLEEMSQSSSPHFTARPTRETETAVILYTSGTTGRSKGAELTHFNMHRNAHSAAGIVHLGEGDRFVATLPLFHSFGQTFVMNASFSHGGAIVLHPRFEAARVLESFQRDGATLFAGVPTMYVYLLKATDEESEGRSEGVGSREQGIGYEGQGEAQGDGNGGDGGSQTVATSLRLCVSGGAPIPVSVFHQFEERFGVPIIEGYGLSETSPLACTNRPERVRKPGSIGIPIPDVEMSVVDDGDRQLGPGEVGEIVIKGPNIMKGYLNRTEATAEAMRSGWFHSGDLGYFDDEGYFYIVDRKKDMILKSGYNVYPREVEEVLYRHPTVAEAAVVGVPDPIKGEEVKAYVVLKESASASEEELINHCREMMAPYKCPKQIAFLPALPKSATGKILRRELRDTAR